MSRNVCQACNNQRLGRKTRKSVPHTCGYTFEQLQEIREREVQQEKEFQERLSKFKNS